MTIPPPGFDSPLAVFEAIAEMADTHDAATDAALNGDFEKAAELDAVARSKFDGILHGLGWAVPEEDDDAPS
jgi:hypothetical protein